MIITLCGSARFETWFHIWNQALGLAGHASFGLCSYPSDHDGQKDWYTSQDKKILDEVHFAKIKASDAVLILNVFAYLGESTLNEIKYSMSLGKRILFLESWGEGCGIDWKHDAKAFGTVRRGARRFGISESYRSPMNTSAFKSPWDGQLMGESGERRSRIVYLVNDHSWAMERTTDRPAFVEYGYFP